MTPEAIQIALVEPDRTDRAWLRDLEDYLSINQLAGQCEVTSYHEIPATTRLPHNAVVVIHLLQTKDDDKDYIQRLTGRGNIVILATTMIPRNGVSYWINDVGVKDIIKFDPRDIHGMADRIFSVIDRAKIAVMESVSV